MADHVFFILIISRLRARQISGRWDYMEYTIMNKDNSPYDMHKLHR